MELFTRNVNGNNLCFYADKSLAAYAPVLFRALETIPGEKIRDGYKLELGFTLFTCTATDNGYQIVAPDYLNAPFLHTTDDLTIALWVLLEQTKLLRTYGISGTATRFDDEIVVAKNALEHPVLSLQRFSDLGKGASGWCVEAQEETPEGSFGTVPAEGYEAIYAYQLLQKRPSLIKVLALPYEYLVILDGD